MTAHPDIVIATITWARNVQEADALLKALECLANHAYPIVVADGGSEGHFLDVLQQLPNVIVHPYVPCGSSRLMSQVKCALAGAGACHPRLILYTEPDKQWFFEHRLATFITQAARHMPLGAGVAARDEESFQTYPAFQRYTEAVTNQLCAEYLGQEGDYLYGPLLINPMLLPHVERLSDDLGWGWRLFAMVIAQRLGLPVTCVTMDLPCPLEQRDEDDRRARLHRTEQLSHNARGLVAGCRCSL